MGDRTRMAMLDDLLENMSFFIYCVAFRYLLAGGKGFVTKARERRESLLGRLLILS